MQEVEQSLKSIPHELPLHNRSQVGCHDNRILCLSRLEVVTLVSFPESERRLVMGESLLDSIEELPDPHHNQGKGHLLAGLIVMTLEGVMRGADEWIEIVNVTEAKRE